MNLVTQLHQQEHDDDEQAGDQRRKRDQRPRLDEEEGRQQRERDGAHAVDHHLVAYEDARDDESHQIGWQHRLALRGRREATQEEQNDEDELDLRLTHPVAPGRDDPACDRRQLPQHGCRDDHKGNQPAVEIGEQDAKRQHRAEVIDEASRQDELAEIRVD